MPVTDVTDADFQTAVIDRSNEVPVVVDLWAEWCGPCKTLGPIIEQVLLPEVLGRFVVETGQVRINTVTDHADTLVELLKTGRLDVIAGPFDAGDHPELVGYPLITDKMV